MNFGNEVSLLRAVKEEIIEFQDRQECQALLGERDEFIRVLLLCNNRNMGKSILL